MWEEFLGKEKEKENGKDKKKEKPVDANEFRLTSIEKALAELTASISGRKKKDPDVWSDASSKNALGVFGWLGGLDGDGLQDGEGYQDFVLDSDDEPVY